MNNQFTWTTEKADEQFLNLPNCLLLIDPFLENAKDLAILISQKKFCEQKNACANCKACRLFKADTHPDFIFYTEPLKIDEVRNLLEKVALTPSIAKERIIFLGKIDQYLPSALNALLKTLEEPPAHSHFILSAKSKRAVLPTILSRSRVFNVPQASYEEAKDYLIKQGFSAEDAELSLKIYRNNPFLALENREKPNPYQYLADYQNFLSNPKNNRNFFKIFRELPDKEKLEIVIKLTEKTISDIQLEDKDVKIKLTRLHNLLAAFYRLRRPYLRQVNQAYAINDLFFKYLEQKRIVL